MASLLEDLNSLLGVERWVVEAGADIVNSLKDTDPDLARPAADVVETASWVCKGLAHRIRQLGLQASIYSPDSMDELDDLPDVRSKIELLCDRCTAGRDKTGEILRRDDLDPDTREFLSGIQDPQCDSVIWCKGAIAQWTETV